MPIPNYRTLPRKPLGWQISKHRRYDVFLVAFLDGELVGTANLAGSTRTRLAHRAGLGIAVERRAWGQGVGTALMHQLLAWARSTDLEIIDLEVRSDNLRAIRPYERFGFVRYAPLRGVL